jgi:putative sporulation protein YtaF
MDLAVWIPAISIALAANLDNAGVGVAYGVRNIKIPALAGTVIAFIGFMLTWIGGISGKVLSAWLPPSVCNIVGMVILVSIGTWVIIQPLLQEQLAQHSDRRNWLTRILQNPETADFNASKSVDFKESVVLGIALSVNNLAGGFDAGITHIGIWETSILSGIFSFASVGLCSLIGRKIAGERLGKSASVLAGLILIFIGLHQVI